MRILHGAFLIVMLASASCILCAQKSSQPSSSPNDTYPTFSLTLSAKASEFRSGSKVRITITQTNLTNHVIDFTSTWTGVDSSFEYEAIDEDGKPAERKPRGTGVRDVHPSNILPGGSGESSVLIDRIFKFDRPGKYVIRVSRQEQNLTDEKGEPLVVWSNPITITITG